MILFPSSAGIDRYLYEEEEKHRTAQAKKKRKAVAQKEAAASVSVDKPPEPGPAPLDSAREIHHRSGSGPAEIGSPPRDKHPAHQSEEVRHTRSRSSRRRKPQRETEEAVELQQPSCPPPNDVDPATAPSDAKAISSKTSGEGSNPPEKDIIDLTIKEESRSVTPIPAPQTLMSDDGPPRFEAGWVRSPGIPDLCAL